MIDEREIARSLVRRWGWNTTAYQILNPGFRYWVDTRIEAVVGYVECHGIRVVGGAPICPETNLMEAMLRFEQDTRAVGLRVVYFGAEQRFAEAAISDERRIVFPIGAQPVWHPPVLIDAMTRRASLRAQLNRARNKGVRTRLLEQPFDQAGLQRCLAEWIETRGLPPMHFLIETQALRDLVDRRVLVAERGADVVGFVLATPIPARRGWLVEQIVRGAGAPNGTAELMLHDIACALADADMITLGLAPLARRADHATQRAPQWLFALLHALRAHGTRFYNFAGLEAFKSKFGGSHWEAVYASTAPGTSLPRTLIALTEAFSAEPVSRFMFRSVWRYARVRAGARPRGPSDRRRLRVNSSARA